MWPFEGDRRQKPVEDPLTRMLHGLERSLSCKEMQVSDRIPAVSAPQQRGGTRIQWNVVDLPGGLGGALAEEAETVLHVFDHIEREREIEESIVGKRISQEEFTTRGAMVAVYRVSLRDHFITGESDRRIQTAIYLGQHTARSAANIADASEGDLRVPPQHAQHLPGFKDGILRMPGAASGYCVGAVSIDLRDWHRPKLFH